MRNLLFVFAALLLAFSIGPVHAGWNIKQNADGTTTWINKDGEQYQVGREYLTINLENMSSASTTFMPVPFAGSIVQVDAVAHGDLTAASAVLTVSILSAVSPDEFIAITTNNTITMASANIGSDGVYILGGAGDRGSSGLMVGKSTDHEDANEQIGGAPVVGASGTIAISTDGASTGDVDATIIIYYDRDTSAATYIQ
jgi:hypothetical protein